MNYVVKDELCCERWIMLWNKELCCETILSGNNHIWAAA